MAKRRRRWLIRTACIAPVLLVVLVAAAAAGKAWLIPHVIRRQAAARLAERWRGRIEIGRIDFNYFGPLRFGDITVRDDADRPCLQVDSVVLSLDNWPSTHPVLAGVEVGEVAVHLYFQDGRLLLPIAPADEEEGEASWQQYVRLRRLAVGKLRVTTVDLPAGGAPPATAAADERRPTAFLGTVEVTDIQQSRPGAVQVRSVAFRDRRQRPWLTAGPVAATFTAEDLAKFVLRGLEVAAVDARLHFVGPRCVLPVRLAAEGGEGTWRGHVDLAGGSGLVRDVALTIERAAGQAEPMPAAAPHFRPPVVLDARQADALADLRIGPVRFDKGTLRVENLTAKPFGATARLFLQVVGLAGDEPTFEGRAAVAGMDLAAVIPRFDPAKKDAQGILTLGYRFAGRGTDPAKVEGKGEVLLEKTNPLQLPYISEIITEILNRTEIFNWIELKQVAALELGDIHSTFTTKGPVVTIRTGKLATRLWAIDVLPGGVVDMDTRHYDVHVVAAALGKVGVIPLIGDFLSSVLKKLAGLHVSGQWDKPLSTLVVPEVLGTVGKGTLGFFREVLKTGGKVGSRAAEGVADVFGADNSPRQGADPPADNPGR